MIRAAAELLTKRNAKRNAGVYDSEFLRGFRRRRVRRSRNFTRRVNRIRGSTF